MSANKPLGLHFNITQQETYSKGQAILRIFLRFFYIAIPHLFVLYFIFIASSFLTFLAWWAILFTGKYPKNWFDFQVKLMRWMTRFTARMWHMADGYPAFGLSKNDPAIHVEVEYPESYSRGNLLIKSFFGFFLIIPHLVCLMFRLYASSFLSWLTGWSIVFTGKYSPNWHKFNVGTLRWMNRVNLYFTYMRDEYPPFNGRDYNDQIDVAQAQNGVVIPLGLVFNIKQQETYSKGQALLRNFFGFFYIGIPHFFLLYFVAIASGFLTMLSWWAILFTGVYPKNWFDFQLKVMRWSLRVSARFLHMTDGYPAFGLSKQDPNIQLEVQYPERMSRGTLLVKSFLSLCLIPHFVLLYFRFIGVFFVRFLTFWSILITGKYNQSWHKYNVDTFRWMLRVGLFARLMRDEFPPFNGAEVYRRWDLRGNISGGVPGFTGPSVTPGSSTTTAAAASVAAATAVSSASGLTQKKTVLVRKPDGTVVKKVIEVPIEGSNAGSTGSATPSTAPTTSSSTSTTSQPSTAAATASTQASKTPTATAVTNKPGSVSPEMSRTMAPQGEKKKTNIAAIVLGILTALFFIGMTLATWKFLTEKASHELDKLSWSEAEKEFRADIASLNEKLDNLNEENVMLRDMIDNPEKQAKVKTLMDEKNASIDRLNRLLASGGGSGGNATKYKKEIEELKQKIAALESELENYKSKVQQLDNDKLALAADLSSQKKKAIEAEGQRKRLQDEVDEASKLDFEDIVAGGIKYKSETSKKDKPKVKALNKIQVCFSISANKIAKAGNRDIYVRIIDPNGQVLSRGGDQQFDLNGEQIKYSLTKSQAYSNKEELVCMYYDKNDDKFTKGNYTAEIYCENRKVGESRFELK